MTRGNEVRMRVAPSVRKPVWIAGIALAVVATAGAGVIARSIPVSYASVAGGESRSGDAVVAGGNADARTHPTLAPATGDSARARPGCSECAVVQSITRVGTLDDINPLDDAAAPAVHQVTVRHRDGATSTFVETTSRTWRPGSRVILIPGMITAGK